MGILSIEEKDKFNKFMADNTDGLLMNKVIRTIDDMGEVRFWGGLHFKECDVSSPMTLVSWLIGLSLLPKDYCPLGVGDNEYLVPVSEIDSSMDSGFCLVQYYMIYANRWSYIPARTVDEIISYCESHDDYETYESIPGFTGEEDFIKSIRNGEEDPWLEGWRPEYSKDIRDFTSSVYESYLDGYNDVIESSGEICMNEMLPSIIKAEDICSNLSFYEGLECGIFIDSEWNVKVLDNRGNEYTEWFDREKKLCKKNGIEYKLPVCAKIGEDGSRSLEYSYGELPEINMSEDDEMYEEGRNDAVEDIGLIPVTSDFMADYYRALSMFYSLDEDLDIMYCTECGRFSLVRREDSSLYCRV